ncbi:TPA: hypothetical protein N0X28_000412 [Proteus mirabilis]|uniref:hypothetical protein n=1 Tax=Proteus mirabilis TaxID=584 RepID=UPI000D6F638E|nr:hypothetical protein [Proteus mirabilis]MBS3827687.1 hypothetical protein [Proteus mirabilis]MBS3838502.1 hypothetical protein [Proteus mirabilis]HCK7312808.1 hypothetical protein [Proteus mirabilis]HCK7316655.1 hypothetical protein [Proteus mirabilis]HCK7325406.1 hypothetical protein [Proteus mirabilis]
MTLEQNLKQEHLVQEQIFDAINEFHSFRFNAGAGAGKTYALIESIKYILSRKQPELKKIIKKSFVLHIRMWLLMKLKNVLVIHNLL